MATRVSPGVYRDEKGKLFLSKTNPEQGSKKASEQKKSLDPGWLRFDIQKKQSPIDVRRIGNLEIRRLLGGGGEAEEQIASIPENATKIAEQVVGVPENNFGKQTSDITRKLMDMLTALPETRKMSPVTLGKLIGGIR